MKNIILLLIILLAFSCERRTEEEPRITIVEEDLEELSETYDYDSSYAQALGADDYGMKKYVMAFLKKGPNRDQDSATAAKIQREHLNNIGRMAEEGKLIVAGPFLDESEIRGIYIFNVETLEEARELTETDPAVQAGRLEMELHPWYGSAVLQEVAKMHKKVAKGEI
ncbi:MAG: YciI family protein [Candidatus Cyclobacteriaceae bacterium M2_1C_046]